MIESPDLNPAGKQTFYASATTMYQYVALRGSLTGSFAVDRLSFNPAFSNKPLTVYTYTSDTCGHMVIRQIPGTFTLSGVSPQVPSNTTITHITSNYGCGNIVLKSSAGIKTIFATATRASGKVENAGIWGFSPALLNGVYFPNSSVNSANIASIPTSTDSNHAYQFGVGSVDPADPMVTMQITETNVFNVPTTLTYTCSRSI